MMVPPGLVPSQQPISQLQPSPLQQQVQQIPTSNNSNGSSPLPPTTGPQYPPGVKVPLPSQTSKTADARPLQTIPTNVDLTGRPASAASGPQNLRNGPAGFPGMGDLVSSFESAKQKGNYRSPTGKTVSYHTSQLVEECQT